MSEIKDVNEKIIQAADLLEQIVSVDKMIGIHNEKNDKQDIMLMQYKFRRQHFLNELKEVFKELNIYPSDLAA